MSTPLVSIVIPTFNCAAYLPAAIDSVLTQNYPQIEIIVVDDGSTDETTAVIEPFLSSVRFIRQENAGIGPARNTGIAASRGVILGFLDADDLFTPGKVGVQVQWLLEHDTIDLVFGQVEEFVSEDMAEEERRRLKPHDGLLAGVSAQAMLIWRSAFDRVGPFAGTWKLGEFLDWYLKAKDLGLRIETLPTVVLKRRLHRSNIGVRERDSRGDYARVLKAAIDRRRAAQA